MFGKKGRSPTQIVDFGSNCSGSREKINAEHSSINKRNKKISIILMKLRNSIKCLEMFFNSKGLLKILSVINKRRVNRPIQMSILRREKWHQKKNKREKEWRKTLKKEWSVENRLHTREQSRLKLNFLVQGERIFLKKNDNQKIQEWKNDLNSQFSKL